MPPRDLTLLSDLKQLTTAFKAGDQGSFKAFRDLVSKLLHLTILRSDGFLHLVSRAGEQDERVLSGPEGYKPLPLNDGRYLRLSILLFREQLEGGFRLKVKESNFQYQDDADGKCWIFRYDYLRYPPEPNPGAHLHVRGQLMADCRPVGKSLHQIHFPTMRVSLEAIIRLLIKEFGVPCNEPDEEVWGPALEQTERDFFDIHHRPLPPLQ